METKRFKPFDKVLVKDDHNYWQIDFYSHPDKDIDTGRLHHVMTYGESLCFGDNDILPYEGNEHLVGRVDEPDEEVRLEEGEWILKGGEIGEVDGYDVIDSFPYDWALGRFEGIDSNDTNCYQSCGYWRYAIRFSDFNPEDMEETKKHILCVRNGKIVRYKP